MISVAFAFLRHSRMAQAALAVAVGVALVLGYGQYQKRQGVLKERDRVEQITQERSERIRDALRDIRGADDARERLRGRDQ